MNARTALAAAAAVVVLAGCSRDSGEILPVEARTEADAFVRLLVAEGNPGAAATHAAGDTARTLSLWHDYLVRDGIHTAEAPGSVRANCTRAFPVFSVEPARGSCIVYRLTGLRPIPGSEDTLATVARFRVWLTETEQGWRVTAFDFTPQISAR